MAGWRKFAIAFAACFSLVGGQEGVAEPSESEKSSLEGVNEGPPSNPAALLKAIKASFDEGDFLDDASFDGAYIRNRFGGAVALKIGGYSAYSAGTENLHGQVCGEGGLCARSLRVQKFFKEGKAFATLSCTFFPGNENLEKTVEDLIGVPGQLRPVPIPSHPRIAVPATAPGAFKRLEFPFANGFFIMQFGADATLSEASYFKAS